MKKYWIELENKIGYDLARIVAMAVSYLGRTDTWRFAGWYKGLKADKKESVDLYFNEYLLLELREMSENQISDISHLVEYFDLPKPVSVYGRYEYKPLDPYYKDMGLTLAEFLKTEKGMKWAKSKHIHKFLTNKYKSND